MKYLLDVNALVAFGIIDHEFHQRVLRWMRGSSSTRDFGLATCPTTELGFVRIVAQTPRYGCTVIEARSLLLKIKAHDAEAFSFISDHHDISYLPGWVKFPKQVTDGHLLELAKAHGAVLATLDTRIPGAYLIPNR